MNQKKLAKDNSGVAMIFALIVGTVIMVFCLLLLLVAYTLYSQTSRQISETQCKVLSQTMAQKMKEEIETKDTEIADYLSNMIKSGDWVAYNDMESNPLGIVNLTMESTIPGLNNYSFEYSFSYSNGVSGGVGSAEVEDDDDEEEIGLEEDLDVPGSGEGGDTPSASAQIIVEVTCHHGEKNGVDHQQYTTKMDCKLDN